MFKANKFAESFFLHRLKTDGFQTYRAICVMVALVRSILIKGLGDGDGAGVGAGVD